MARNIRWNTLKTIRNIQRKFGIEERIAYIKNEENKKT